MLVSCGRTQRPRGSWFNPVYGIVSLLSLCSEFAYQLQYPAGRILPLWIVICGPVDLWTHHLYTHTQAFLNVINSPRAQTTKICSIHMCRLWDYAHSIQSQLFFWNFCPKNRPKRPKNGPKMSGFGLVWFG